MKIEKQTIAPGETVAGVQICPVGDFPNGENPQHCSEDALRFVVEDWIANGRREILCDFEHQSEEGGTSDTSAAAWVGNLRVEPGRGLVGDFKFTDLGADAVTNRRLRFLSVGWIVDNKTHRPLHITSIALTNKPNIPVAPILNKEPQATKNVEDTKEPEMDKLKEMLGLSPEATEEDVLAAVGKLKEDNAALNKEREEAEADKFAEENQKVCNKETLKAAYLANKELAKSMVAGIVKPEPAKEPKQTLLNRAPTATPAVTTKVLNREDARTQLAALPPEQRAAFYRQHQAEID